MPAISRFYGIVIKMFYNEHNPPHFHVVYGEYMGSFDINSGGMIEGDLPKKARALVSEWLILHKNELIEIWNTQEYRSLPPLE